MNLSILLMAVALAAPSSSVQDLAWMSGCWASVGGEAGSGEMWMAPAGGTLLGVSRTVKRGKTVAHEFMQIRETGPGQIAFIALPSGQKEASFPLVRLSGQEAVFENPQHDFPQRVIYRRVGDLLTGRVEGSEGGETKGFDFPMERRPCT
ncbi:MAG TPA: DUF6265 family protein [Thermoanaerobaculia bacterium]|nr:DUF6265 family protein [Thermoanaerobaculia bacterium]